MMLKYVSFAIAMKFDPHWVLYICLSQNSLSLINICKIERLVNSSVLMGGGCDDPEDPYREGIQSKSEIKI